MKLSDAMRLGATFRAQAFGLLFVENKDGGIDSCALGAVCEVHGMQPVLDQQLPEWLFDTYPELDNVHTICPVSLCYATDSRSILSVIVHLNDHHQWSREAIADWLDSITLDTMPATVEAPAQVEAAP